MEKYTNTKNYDIGDLEEAHPTKKIGCAMSMGGGGGGGDEEMMLVEIEDLGRKAKVYVKRERDGELGVDAGKKRFLEELLKSSQRGDSLLREERKEEVVSRGGICGKDVGLVFCWIVHMVCASYILPDVCATFPFWLTIIYTFVNLGIFGMGLVHTVDTVIDWIFRPTRKTVVTYVPDEGLFQKAMRECGKKVKIGSIPTKSDLLYHYRMGVNRGEYERNEVLEHFLVTKKMRSTSGVIVVSVIMPPGNFSCSYDCAYCPNDPRYSRSYYHGEPTVMRGARNGFSGFMQFRERIHSYVVNGHPVDKIECIVLGGTFSCYKPADAEDFICDLYYAANTAFDDPTALRPREGIEEEQKRNETAACRMIGLTIETRPDMISKHELRRLRRLGVTRVQMGAQHTDDAILAGVDRRATVEDTKKALRLLKDECFKVDLHWMPDLPGSSLEKDRAMFREALMNPDLAADQWKIYPTNVLPYTKIKEWYDAGTYKPYTEVDYEGFLKMVTDVLNAMPPYVRVNRIQRDFPAKYIQGGNKVMHLRGVLEERVDEYCQEMRHMEVREDTSDIERARLVLHYYEAQGDREVFISYKSCDCKEKGRKCKAERDMWWYGTDSMVPISCGFETKIYGFLRLRLANQAGKEAFSALQEMALIRELHVYGHVVPVYAKGAGGKVKAQHYGFGKKMMAMAEKIARIWGAKGTAVISGVGVREYYRKLGYEIPEGDVATHGNMMIKRFPREEEKHKTI